LIADKARIEHVITALERANPAVLDIIGDLRTTIPLHVLHEGVEYLLVVGVASSKHFLLQPGPPR
jgi:hypothetical protein